MTSSPRSPNTPLRVLITNRTLAGRSGTETYVRDLALALLRLGQQPIVYSPRLGAIASELRDLTVPVVDDLAQVAAPPDIIHGHHHVETMNALLHFQNAPAVFVCHSWLSWDDVPPRFPRLLRYVAVDDTCRDRLISREGIAPERVAVVYNSVDLVRFSPRGALPPKPRRALIFSNLAHEKTQIPAVRAACAKQGIALEVVGEAADRGSAQPEVPLREADIVFAKDMHMTALAQVEAEKLTLHGMPGI